MSALIINFPTPPVFGIIREYQIQKEEMERNLLILLVNHHLSFKPMFRSDVDEKQYNSVTSTVKTYLDGFTSLQEQVNESIKKLQGEGK